VREMSAIYIFLDLLIVASGYVALAWGFGMIGLQRSLTQIGCGTVSVAFGFFAIFQGLWHLVHF
jgi:hypothetical protein